MFIKKPLEPILNQKYLRKDETSNILDTFDAPMINVSAVNPIGQSGDKITLIGKMFDDEIEGRNIDFYDGSTYLGTGQTNKYGVGIFDYTCSGAGTKEIIGKWGDKTSNSILIEDCWEYIENPTAANSLNINLPTAGKISFKVTKHNSNGVFILLGDGSHTYYVGNWASDTTNGFLIRNNGSSSNLVEQKVENIPYDTEVEITCEYDNGKWIYGANGNSISFTANYTPTTLTNITIQGTCTMKDLKIEPKHKVELTASKSILSHANSETSVLTATLSIAQTGQVVELYDENDNYIADMTDNEDGTYSYTYHSQGAGDIGFYAQWGMILSETYSIEDCIEYFNSEYTSAYDFNYELPSTFKIEYEAYYVNDTASYLIVGESENKGLFTGHVSSTETNYSVWARNGSDSKNFGSQMVYNSYIPQTISYDGANYNFNDDIIISNLNGVTPSKLIKIRNYNTGWKFRNIKIKPL